MRSIFFMFKNLVLKGTNFTDIFNLMSDCLLMAATQSIHDVSMHDARGYPMSRFLIYSGRMSNWFVKTLEYL